MSEFLNHKISKKLLTKLYISQKFSVKNIAIKFNCKSHVITNLLKFYNIQLKTISEALKGNKNFNKINSLRKKQFETKIKKLGLSKKVLKLEYMTNSKPVPSIAKEKNTNNYTIYKLLDLYNIPIKPQRYRYDRKNKVWNCNPEKQIEHYCKENECNNGICYFTWIYGGGRCQSHAEKKKTENKEYNNQKSKRMKETWKKIDYVTKWKEGCKKSKGKKPNNIEHNLCLILSELFTEKYKYVGDFKFWIDRYNPDFINKKDRKIIELFGDFWHANPNKYRAADIVKHPGTKGILVNTIWKEDEQRIKTFKKADYKTLVIWEHELKEIKILKNKILRFDNE